MQLNIGKGPDFRVSRGKELMTYKFVLKELQESRIYRHRSLAMVSRSIAAYLSTPALSHSVQFFQIAILRDRISIRIASMDRELDVIFDEPKQLTPSQVFKTLKNLSDLIQTTNSQSSFKEYIDDTR